MPSVFQWDGLNANFTAYGSHKFGIHPVKIIQLFKEAMSLSLTDRGARAILHRVTKRGGVSVGQMTMATYGWKEMGAALESMDLLMSRVFPSVGWCVPRIRTMFRNNGNALVLLKGKNCYETEGVSLPGPVCIIFQSYIEGIGEALSSSFTGKTVESRELSCVARGDDCCTFILAEKTKGSGILDFNELRGDIEHLESMIIPS